VDDIVNLSVLPKEGAAFLDALKEGRMVVARSQNDFLFILDSEQTFVFFSHRPGSPEGGRKQFPRDEKHIAIVKNLATVADAVYSVEYHKDMNFFGVMSSAEHGILSLFPGDARDEDEEIEFVIPNKEGEGEQ
jgi:endo-alpha-1,4-polygalactosaminidase (GH114 family)